MNTPLTISNRMVYAQVTGTVRNEHEAEEFKRYARHQLRGHLAGIIAEGKVRYTASEWSIRAQMELVVLTVDELHQLIREEACRLGNKPYTAVVCNSTDTGRL